jgi:hypothetical protein
MNLYIALHYHKHGVSSILVAGRDEDKAHDKAVAWFKKHDDLTDADLDMDDPGWDGERVEVGRTTLPRGYKARTSRRARGA